MSFVGVTRWKIPGVMLHSKITGLAKVVPLMELVVGSRNLAMG